MCLIIYKPKNKKVSLETLKSAHSRNKDGWGMMRLNSKGEVYVERGLSDFDKFLEVYNLRFADHECAIHFRKATSGKVTKDQCHPYEITPDDWLMHNGHILGLPEYNKNKSDTWHFTQYIKQMVEGNWLSVNDFVSILEAVFWNNQNKGVLLSKKNGWIFLNKELGRNYDGCWYSNTYAWDLPADLAAELAKEQWKRQPAWGSWSEEADKLKAKVNNILIIYFANEIHKNNLSPDVLEDEIPTFKEKVLRAVLDLDEATNRVTNSIPAEYRVLDGDSGSAIVEVEDGLEIEDFDTSVPKMPESWLDLCSLDISDLKEINYHYPDEMAGLIYQMINSGVVVT